MENNNEIVTVETIRDMVAEMIDRQKEEELIAQKAKI
jgi:hypothetical protein